jgi:hypothetical protein
MKKLILLASISLLAACAQPAANNAKNAEAHGTREYPTGSNFPRRAQESGVTVYDREAVMRSQEMSPGIPRER